jgi:tRNA-splicing ligase RtcB (3'-phosphate/5'-hydroxy nucleic acid ligase)
MIHSGSRGLDHLVDADTRVHIETAMARDGITTNDRQLSSAGINPKEGQDYLAAMFAAANFAWARRSCMTYLARQAFAKTFEKSHEREMHLIYDVSHKIAKIEHQKFAVLLRHCWSIARREPFGLTIQWFQ